MPPRNHSNTNILLVANYESDIGYAWWLMESYWSALAENFQARGQHSYLIFPKLTTLSDRVRASPVIPIELNFNDRSPTGIAKLRHFIKEHSIGTVYLTDRAYMDMLFPRLRIWGVRRIIMHDHTPGERPPPGILKRIAKSLVHRMRMFSCDHYIGVSRFVRDRLVTNACIPPERCSYVHNGIIPIARDETETHYVHQAFGLPRHARIIVTTGRATGYKGIDFFIDCAAELRRRRRADGIFFLHCGDGPDLPRFNKAVKEQGLEQIVILAGRRDDVRRILPSCRIAIQTSLGEAFSLSVLEYMSAGLATLAPANCGHREVITHGVTGFLYPPRDLDTAVGLIDTLLSDDDLRERFGQNARRLINEEFTLDRATRELTALVDQLTAEP